LSKGTAAKAPLIPAPIAPPTAPIATAFPNPSNNPLPAIAFDAMVVAPDTPPHINAPTPIAAKNGRSPSRSTLDMGLLFMAQ